MKHKFTLLIFIVQQSYCTIRLEIVPKMNNLGVSCDLLDVYNQKIAYRKKLLQKLPRVAVSPTVRSNEGGEKN